DGRPKRWVVVRPPGAATGVLLARADGEDQARVVGRQAAGRVGFFLRVDDFDDAYQRMSAAGVEFVRSPCSEPYGRVAVVADIAGNRWDLLGPRGAGGRPAVVPDDLAGLCWASRTDAVCASAGRKASSFSSAIVTSTAVAKLMIVVMRHRSPREERSCSGTAKPRWPDRGRVGGTYCASS